VTISVAFVPFVVPAALAFKVSIRTGGGPQEVWDAFLLWTHTIRAPITVVVLSIIVAFSLRSRRRIKSEMRRLEGLRRGYEIEAEEER
jgi:heme/copper-type cytochrome/quinol oxidase subunit 2